jgi:hypothetical protein
VRAALGRGCRFGLIASSDGHDGHPGNAQSPLFKHHHLFHHGGSGWVAAICPELTRAAVFDALYRRSCYGTTGVPILLWFEVNGHPMGSELDAAAAGSRPRLTLQCQGTNGIDHIRVVRNGQVVHTVSGYGEPTLAFEWEDETPRRDLADCYYVRVVQVDRESAWSSPVWLSR